MEPKSNDPTPQRPEPAAGHPLDAPLLVFDLPALLAQVREEPAYRASDRNALTLFKTDGMRLVLLALHAGAELKTHTAPGTISVQVLAGRLTFHTAEQAAELAQGQLLTLHAGIPHRVVAVTEAAFLLTLAVPK